MRLLLSKLIPVFRPILEETSNFMQGESVNNQKVITYSSFDTKLFVRSFIISKQKMYIVLLQIVFRQTSTNNFFLHAFSLIMFFFYIDKDRYAIRIQLATTSLLYYTQKSKIKLYKPTKIKWPLVHTFKNAYLTSKKVI